MLIMDVDVNKSLTYIVMLFGRSLRKCPTLPLWHTPNGRQAKAITWT